jgi:hypothetical protein
MTENTVVFLFRMIRISESRYAVTLFRSCQNLLLYHAINFFLMLTTKCSLTVSKLTVSQYTTLA